MATVDISGLLGSQVADNANAKLLAWQDSVVNAVIAMNPKMASAARFSGTVPLHMLPVKSQVSFMKAWREIIGLDKVLNEVAVNAPSRTAGIDKVFNTLKTISPRDSKSPFLRFPVSGKSFIDDYYRSLNLNFSEKIRPVISGLENRDAGNLSSHFGPGIKSIPKLTSEGLNLTRSMPGNASFMTFDIETAGLMDYQHREISYKTGRTGPYGQVDIDNTVNKQILFRPRAFDRGTMGILDESGVVQPHSLEGFLENKYNMKISNLPTKNLGKDYAERMLPWLESVGKSDYVIGHNIARFDVPQIFTALAGTAAYQSGDQSIIPGFRALVDSTHTSLQSKMIDTLALARTAPNLANLGVARELSAMGNLSTYSIENLLLETDLADIIGLDELQKKMGTKGLHFGEVDDFVTLNIYKYIRDIQPKELGGTPLANGIRSQILGSVAITPTSNIRKQSEVIDPVLRHIIGIEGAIDTKSTQLNELLQQARAGDQKAAELAFSGIRGEQYNDLRFNLNPIEQQVIATRNLQYGRAADVSLNTDNLIFKNNIFTREIYDEYDPNRDFSRGILDQKRLSQIDMPRVQKRLAEAGMPWAGLSLEERSLGTVLSHLTSGVNASSTVNDISALTSDTLISRFEEFDPNKVAYTTYSGRPSMPASLLERAGLIGGDTPALLNLSSVNPTIEAPETRMNLVYNFKEGEAQRLSAYLTDLAENPDSRFIAGALGIETDLLDDGSSELLGPVDRFKEAVKNGDLIEKINEGGRGVAIGQLQPAQAEGVARAVGNFAGLDVLSDKSTMGFGLPYARRKNGVIETSGVVLTRHLNPGDLPEIGREVRHSTKVMDAYQQLTDTGNEFKLKAAQAASKASDEGAARIEKVYNIYQSIRPHQGKMLAAGLIISAGILYANRHNEVQQYAPAMQQMPYESGSQRYMAADMLQMSIDSGINKGYQRYDPLATAFVTSNLSDSAIGHTSMNWDKNNALYGGVL